MKAIILNHPKDIEIFKTKNQNLNFYAYNFYTYLRLRKKYKYVKYVNDQKLLSSYNEFSKNFQDCNFDKDKCLNNKDYIIKRSNGKLIIIKIRN